MSPDSILFAPAHKTVLVRAPHLRRMCRWCVMATLASFLIEGVAGAGHGVTAVRAEAQQLLLHGRQLRAGRLVITEREAAASAPAREAMVVAEAPADFTIALPRFDGARDRLFSSFQAWSVAADGVLTQLGTNRFVDPFEMAARWEWPFPSASSKKGLQIQMVDDALALGIKHAALNVNLTAMLQLGDGTNGLTWAVDGHTVRVRSEFIAALDREVRPLTGANVVVSLILLTYASGDPLRDRLMLHPNYDRRAPNHLGAFNTSTVEGARCFRACLEFLADHYGRPEFGGRVANYILGNEVNSHWFWSNMGRVSMETFAEDYLRTARLASAALGRMCSNARLYLSLEHHWNMRYPGGQADQAFPGRAFLDYFNRRAREQGDFAWHVAFHPYPENLFEPRTWNDRSATPNEDTPRITFKNIEQLTRYLRRPEFLQADGTARHVLLSEQGFHTTAGPEGEQVQAAAYAYAYYKCSRLAGIDAFILHRHVDHGGEGGLRLGLWTRNEKAPSPAEPARRKRIYEVFRAADTPAWQEAFAFALPVIGLRDWSDLDAALGE